MIKLKMYFKLFTFCLENSSICTNDCNDQKNNNHTIVKLSYEYLKWIGYSVASEFIAIKNTIQSIITGIRMVWKILYSKVSTQNNSVIMRGNVVK